MPTKQYIKKLNGYYVKDEDARQQIVDGDRLRIKKFENVAAMKADQSLAAGERVRTAGYYQANDGGAGEYLIVESEAADNAGTILVLENDLRAELIRPDNVNQFGAYGDGLHDDTDAIQRAFNSDKVKTLNFLAESTYLISDAVTLTNKIFLKGNKAVIKSNHADAKIVIAGNGLESYQAAEYLYFDGDFKSAIGIEVSGCRSWRASQIYVRNVCEKGIYVHEDPVTGFGSLRLDGFSIENVIENNDQYEACADSIGLDIENTDCEITNGNIKEFKKAIKCQSSTLVSGVHAWNYRDEFVADSIMIDAYGGLRVINSYCDGLPIFVKQNNDSVYTNTNIINCIYNYGISQQVTAHPYVVYKGEHDHVNMTDCSIDMSYSDGTTSTWPVANTFENVYQKNNFVVRGYFENFYKGTLTDENIGTLYYERVNDVVYFNFEGSGNASSNASFADRIPTWARPSENIRLVLTTVEGVYPRFTITKDGEVMLITKAAWANGSASYPARYDLQKI